MKNILQVFSSTPHVIQRVKQGTFRYVEQVCREGLGVRFGGAFSSYIEAEAYYDENGNTEVEIGDAIYFYKEYDVDADFNPIDPPVRHLVSRFVVKDVILEKKTYSFSAYDEMEKLNVDFSAQLKSMQSSFPMTVKAFLDEVVNFAAPYVEISTLDWYTDAINSNLQLEYFYADGITVRDILSYFAELSFQYMQVIDGFAVTFQRFSVSPPDTTAIYWHDADRYIVAPTDRETYTGEAEVDGATQTVNLVPVFYKENGLKTSDFSFANTKSLAVRWISGNVRIVVAIDDGENPYDIQKNILIDSLPITGTIGQGGWGKLRNLLGSYSISPVEIHLFPFRNPFKAGQILPHIIDTNGNTYQSVIMKMEETDSEVVITCSGEEYYFTDSAKNYDAVSDVNALNVAINKLASNIDDLETEVDGKVSKTGDTMSGALNMDDAFINSLISGITVGTPPSSAKYIQFLRLLDSANTMFARFRGVQLTNGRVGLNFGANRSVNGSTVENNIALYVDDSGNRTVGLSSAAAWLNALGLGTSGALPITIAQGGSGQTAVSSTTTASDILTANSDCTVIEAQYSVWGKVAFLRVGIKKTTAVTSGTTLLGTVVSGKRPSHICIGSCQAVSRACYLNSAGGIYFTGAIAAGQVCYMGFTYLLA